MPWQVIASSVAGSSHSRHGAPCQDAFCFKVLDNNVIAIAVSDGAGSAEYGGEGAKIAVSSAVNFLADHTSSQSATFDVLLSDALYNARCAVVAAAQQAGVQSRTYACTCMIVLASPDEAAVTQVGDGAVIVEDGEGLTALTVPPSAEYANETTFLTSDDWRSATQLAKVTMKVLHIAAFTDGLQRLALHLPAGTPYPGFFRPLLNFSKSRPVDGNSEIEAFLQSRKVSERTDDDVTLVIASMLH